MVPRRAWHYRRSASWHKSQNDRHERYSQHCEFPPRRVSAKRQRGGERTARCRLGGRVCGQIEFRKIERNQYLNGAGKAGADLAYPRAHATHQFFCPQRQPAARRPAGLWFRQGAASSQKSGISSWSATCNTGKPAGLVMLMDIRHPLRIRTSRCWAGRCASMPVHILLTKADKLKRGPAQNTCCLSGRARRPCRARSVQCFSSLKRQGVDELGKQINRWLTDASVMDPLPETQGAD